MEPAAKRAEPRSLDASMAPSTFHAASFSLPSLTQVSWFMRRAMGLDAFSSFAGALADYVHYRQAYGDVAAGGAGGIRAACSRPAS
jgi:hypothetical protein